MRSITLYSALLLLLVIQCASCSKQEPMIPSLKETFSKGDKNPFGSYVFYNQLKQLFYHNELHTKREHFENVWQNISDTASIYISVSKNLFLSKAGQKAMLGFVNNGNTMFISSENIDSTLLDSLGCKAGQLNLSAEELANMQYTYVKMDSSFYAGTTPYTYFYFPLNNNFKQYDTSTTNVLGINKFGKANFIEVFYGKGRFYLQCEPRAFSNYFLLQNKNYQYLQDVFAFTNATPEHVYWDDYYNKKNYPPSGQGSKNAFQLLLQYPSTAWAFWLTLLLLALYILFGGKRRQRIVATIATNTNTTVAFTETVARLYLQKKDNRNMADKMIMYFQEHIRKQYYLNTSQVNEDFIRTLSRKVNVQKEITEALFKTITLVQNSAVISDQQLLLLNQQIEKFYKNKI